MHFIASEALGISRSTFLYEIRCFQTAQDIFLIWFESLKKSKYKNQLRFEFYKFLVLVHQQLHVNSFIHTRVYVIAMELVGSLLEEAYMVMLKQVTLREWTLI